MIDMGMRPLADLVGLDDPVEPAAMRFTAKPGKSCSCCLFKGQRARICAKATSIALRSDLPDCDDGFVYVPILTDPRQLTIA